MRSDAQAGRSSSVHDDLLYVANANTYPSTVTVYGGPKRNLVRTITDGVKEPDSLALDPSGVLYVSNVAFHYNTVTVYANQGRTLVRAISRNIVSPDQVALDASGNLYVLDKRSVNEYVNGKSRVMHSIKMRNGDTMAFDAAGDLYVALTPNAVSVFPPGSKTPSRTITDGIFDPISIAVDSSGNLYVANVFAGTEYCGKSPHGGDVTVYAPGNDSPIYTITPSQGICFPGRLAIDGENNLYVANGPPGTEIPGSVTVYAPGGALLRTITDGINAPDAIVLDGRGYLYVANAYGNTVTEYGPGSTSVSQTISNGVNYPLSLAVGR